VSVCIPAYRREKELKEALASVFSQGFPDVEILVGDDSGELEPVVGRAGRDVRYIRNETRLGMAGNWTQLLDVARGQYCLLLMDDDRLSSEFLRRTVPVMQADSTVGMVFSNHYYDFGGSAKLKVRRCELEGGRHESFLKPLLEHHPVAISACLIRKAVWDEIRPLPDLLTADVVMFIRAALGNWAFFYVDEPLMVYRVHAGQQSASEMRFRDDGVKCWSMFTFEDPESERMRRERLAGALVSRGASHLKGGLVVEAERDLLQAKEILGTLGSRERALLAMAQHPLFRRIGLGAKRAMGPRHRNTDR